MFEQERAVATGNKQPGDNIGGLTHNPVAW